MLHMQFTPEDTEHEPAEQPQASRGERQESRERQKLNPDCIEPARQVKAKQQTEQQCGRP